MPLSVTSSDERLKNSARKIFIGYWVSVHSSHQGMKLYIVSFEAIK